MAIEPDPFRQLATTGRLGHSGATADHVRSYLHRRSLRLATREKRVCRALKQVPGRPAQKAGFQSSNGAVSKMLSPLGTESSNPSPSSGESVSLPELSSRVENPGFPRGCARLAWRPGRQRRSACIDSAPTCRNISVGPYSSTAVPVTVADENTMPAPTKSGLLRGERAVDL